MYVLVNYFTGSKIFLHRLCFSEILEFPIMVQSSMQTMGKGRVRICTKSSVSVARIMDIGHIAAN